MIVIKVDASAVTRAQKELSGVKGKVPQALKSAVNTAAKQARERLVAQAQKAYTVKAGRLKKAVTIKNANVRNLTAVITARGKPMELKDFKTSPASPPKKQRKRAKTRAKVYSVSQLKPLEKNGIKAFVTRFKNGHVSVAQRKTKKRLPIKVLFSTSIPHMIGNEEQVYQIILPDVQRIYGDEVSKQFEKLFAKLRDSV